MSGLFDCLLPVTVRRGGVFFALLVCAFNLAWAIAWICVAVYCVKRFAL